MAPVVLQHTYYLYDWRISRYSYLDRHSISDPGTMRVGTIDVLLTVTNPNPVDASFRVAIFGSDGLELTRPRGPGGSGSFPADFGFPASATLASRNQIRFFLDNTTSKADYYAYGWVQILSSLPLLLSAQALDTDGSAGDFIPIVSADDLNSVTLQQPLSPGDGTPPPPRAGNVAPPFALEEAPPIINPKLYVQSDVMLARAGMKETALSEAIATATARLLAKDIRGSVTTTTTKPKGWSLFGRRTER